MIWGRGYGVKGSAYFGHSFDPPSILPFFIAVINQLNSICFQTGEFSPTFAISHVRDALIAPVDRLALAECWTDACQFIAKNESRVREETQLIKGEDYLVWR